MPGAVVSARRSSSSVSQRTSSSLGQHAHDGQPMAELLRGPRRELLHPAGPQAQGLAGHRPRGGRRCRPPTGRPPVPGVDRRQVGRAADAGRQRGPAAGVAGSTSSDGMPLGAGLGQRGEGQRGRRHGVPPGADQQAGHGLVAVQGGQRTAAVEQHGHELGVASPSTEGTSARSRSTRRRCRRARAGSAAGSRPTRQAARRRRAGGRGSRCARSPGRGVAPHQVRGRPRPGPPPRRYHRRAAQPRGEAAPVRVGPRAARRAAGRARGPARAVTSGSGKVSATGPGPSTGPVEPPAAAW